MILKRSIIAESSEDANKEDMNLVGDHTKSTKFRPNVGYCLNTWRPSGPILLPLPHGIPKSIRKLPLEFGTPSGDGHPKSHPLRLPSEDGPS